MGRHKSPDSEVSILRALAAERREKRPAELMERNGKIVRMAAIGCSMADIARRYGISEYQAGKIVREHDKERHTKTRTMGPDDIGRACFCND